MDQIKILISSYNKLFNWLQKTSFKGFDPYDALNSNCKFYTKNRNFRLIITYINKFSPINFRKILKIKKSIDKQAISLIIRSLIILDYRKRVNINKYINYLINKSENKIYGYFCWNGHNYWIQTRNEYQSPKMPGIIGTESCAQTLFDYHKIYPDEKTKSVLFSVRDFFLNFLYCEYKNQCFFRYKPSSSKNEFIYNASIIAAMYILRINNYFNLDYGTSEAKKAVTSVLKQQKKNGSWYYSINLDTNKEKKQIDFHQGFILDSILEYLKYYPNEYIQKSYLLGLHFYKNNQFNEYGLSYFRFPRKNPIDIHNQAQGIITFSRGRKISDENLDFAQKIAIWTIKNMQDTDGFFYYQKYQFINNKIPYIRWAQAWMLYALSILISELNKK